jgi:hypothetical protein
VARFSELQDRELRDIAPERHRGDEVRYRATTIGAVDACLSDLPWIVLITDRGTGQAKLKIWFTSTFRISSKRWSSSPGKPLATSSPVRRSEEERWIRVNRAGSKKCVYPLTHSVSKRMDCYTAVTAWKDWTVIKADFGDGGENTTSSLRYAVGVVRNKAAEPQFTGTA